MSGRLPLKPPELERRIVAPFTVVIDTRETLPYTFSNIRSNADQGHTLIEVPTIRLGLPTGDYMTMGYPQCVVERKTKDDLFASVARRANFEGRLERMSELEYGAVVVEAEFMSCIRSPPAFTKFHPKALSRTIIAWSQRYVNVHWWWLPGREAAEVVTFRLLERFWLDHQVENTKGGE